MFVRLAESGQFQTIHRVGTSSCREPVYAAVANMPLSVWSRRGETKITLDNKDVIPAKAGTLLFLFVELGPSFRRDDDPIFFAGVADLTGLSAGISWSAACKQRRNQRPYQRAEHIEHHNQAEDHPGNTPFAGKIELRVACKQHGHRQPRHGT